ncbi:hypothetical protein THAOC_36832, partial [Thalassiosira oceanica]
MDPLDTDTSFPWWALKPGF